METYLLKFSACLLVFWLVYVLFLERQTMHRFKRFYLLGAVASALIIPMLTVIHYIEPVVRDFDFTPQFIPVESDFLEMPLQEPPFWNLESVLWLIYGLGAIVFTIRFAINLFKMYRRISENETVNKRSLIYVLLEECRIPHSFFKYIFLSRLKFETETIPKEVLLHEETHAKQLHSIDIIAIEILQIVFWFHPLVYILKHHIKLNHEFLADQAVLNQGADAKTYQNILLQFSSPDSYRDTDAYQLSSAINYSSIKKRFTVMKTQTSKTRIWVSGLLLLPIIAILFYSFAEKEYVEKERVDISQLQNTSTNEGATPAMMKEYNNWITEFNTTHSTEYFQYKRIVAIYDVMMTETQQKSVKPYPMLPERNLSTVEARVPTRSQFESWKNKEQYALWLDGKHISNSVLDNYSSEDIVHYIGTKMHQDLRPEIIPQPFQVNLYTEAGFKNADQLSLVNHYKEINKTYTESIKAYLNGSQIDNAELRIIKAQADNIYNEFTKEEFKKYNILSTPPVPAEKQQKATPKQVAAYNTWAKKMNTAMAKAEGSNDYPYPIVKLKEVNTYKAIYSIMSGAQKEASESWPSFPPPPVRPNTSKKQENKTIKPIEIRIKKDKSLILNNNIVSLQNFISEVKKINHHLTISEQREYLNASIIIESNDQLKFSQKIQEKLKKANIYNWVIDYAETKRKAGLPIKHFNLNNGLTIEEARKQRQKMLKDTDDKSLDRLIDSLNKKNDNKWSYRVETSIIETPKITDSEADNLPSISKNPSFLEFIIDMEQKGATFFLDDKKITLEEAKSIAKTNNGKSTEMITQLDENGKYIVKFSSPKLKNTFTNKTKDGEIIEIVEDDNNDMSPKYTNMLPIVNEKAITSGQIKMTLIEVNKLKLTLPKHTITEFKFKIPGIKTAFIKGNRLTTQSVKNLNTMKLGDFVTLFDIKDNKGTTISPVAIEIIE